MRHEFSPAYNSLASKDPESEMRREKRGNGRVAEKGNRVLYL